MTSPGYLRFPHIHGDLLTFVAEDDVWLAPADGGRAWRLTSDGRAGQQPAVLAGTAPRSPGPAGGTADPRSTRPTRTAAPRPGAPTGATRGPASAAGRGRRGARGHRRRPAVGQCTLGVRRAARRAAAPRCRSARSTTWRWTRRDRPADRRSAATRRTGSATGAAPRAGSGSRPATTRSSPGCCSDLDGQLAAPMLVGGRLVFLVRPRGHRQPLLVPRSTAATCGGTPTTTASTPATRRPTAAAIVYHVRGRHLAARQPGRRRAPRKLDIQLSSPPGARAPRADHRERPPRRPRLRRDRPGQRGRGARHRALADAHATARPGRCRSTRPPAPGCPGARHDRQGRLGDRRAEGGGGGRARIVAAIDAELRPRAAPATLPPASSAASASSRRRRTGARSPSRRTTGGCCSSTSSPARSPSSRPSDDGDIDDAGLVAGLGVAGLVAAGAAAAEPDPAGPGRGRGSPST